MEFKQRELRWLHFGAFHDDHAACAAARECREQGFEVVDVHGPYPIHGIEEALGMRRSRLTWACFLFGLTGFTVAWWLQFYTSWHDWPVNVGGKPFNSWPAFVPVAFELTVLFASLGVVATFFLSNGLCFGRRPRLPEAAVTDDEFVVVVRDRGVGLTQTNLESIWSRHGAIRVWDQMEEVKK